MVEQKKGLKGVENRSTTASPPSSSSHKLPARESPLKKEPKRKLPLLPQLEQPGGRNDPLRQGLSGAGSGVFKCIHCLSGIDKAKNKTVELRSQGKDKYFQRS